MFVKRHMMLNYSHPNTISVTYYGFHSEMNDCFMQAGNTIKKNKQKLVQI